MLKSKYRIKEDYMEKNLLSEFSDALANAVELAGKSTVLVDARRRLPSSGIAYATDLILTADHTIEQDEDIRILLSDGSQMSAKVAGRDPGSDLALLRLERSTLSVIQPADQPARIGQFALAIGRPSPEGVQASLGVVSSIGGPVRTGRGAMLARYIRTDCIPYPGFSGGPLVDSSGKLLGVNTSGLARGIALTIPTGIALKVAESLAAHGHIRRAYLGIRSQPVELAAEAQIALQRKQSGGLLLVGVEAGSPAARAGLMVGDILVGLGGQEVASHDELFAMLAGEVVGQEQTIEVLRGGERRQVQITYGEM
jgi:S1-C subfamily serine protease